MGRERDRETLSLKREGDREGVFERHREIYFGRERDRETYILEKRKTKREEKDLLGLRKTKRGSELMRERGCYEILKAILRY